MPPVVLEPVLTVTVVEPLPETVSGLKVALAPVGSPDRLKLTVPLKPFSEVVVTLYVELLPASTLREAGVELIWKSGDVCTVRVAEVLWLSEPLVAVTPGEKIPVPPPAEVEMLNVVVPEPAMDVGLNVAEAPLGRPVATKVTVPLNPFTAVTVTVKFTVPPGAMLVDGGVMPMVKSAVETVTTRDAEATCVREPLVAVRESG